MDNFENEIKIPESIPLLPVRDIVIFPYMVIPLIVGRESTKAAVEKALSADHLIFMASQKDPTKESPGEEEIYNIGTISSILKMMKMPDGNIKILVQGLRRGKIAKFNEKEPCYMVSIDEVKDTPAETDFSVEARVRNLKERLNHAVSLGKPMLPDLLAVLETIEEPDKLVDIIASNLGLKLEDAQEILESPKLESRLDKVTGFLNHEISILEIQHKIFSDAKGEIDKGQREYFLREQLKAIKRELGEDEFNDKESSQYAKKIKKAKMPKDVKLEAEKQLDRLSHMHQDSAESNVVRTYLDWLTELPWGKSTEDSLDIKNAAKVLDDDHYGLDDVKDRILDFLALRKLNTELKSPILCLVGPPGVGKTSLGKSIARAMGRSFVRMSMGGVRDEAEIRGHRRTYIGALPGKIIQGLKTAGTNNPVFILDEVDKIGNDFRGDPSSALLEVLDPVQNTAFVDHYIALPFDLSKVLFVTTANSLETIPNALRDRMEIIRIPGYTEEEKLVIAEKYIIPRQIKESGLTNYNVTFERGAIMAAITGYTQESGLRALEQVIGKICRKIGRSVAEGKIGDFKISKRNLQKYLGPVIYLGDDELKRNDVGVVTGLAWTQNGGEVLFVECSRFKGKGSLQLTGMLGDVMKESSQAAMTYVKTVSAKYGASLADFADYDYHVHVPAGAIPKDGPSAGITIATAILSTVTNKPVRKDVAMTGEITITGKVLPIGGLKEKLLAAKRMGVKTVIIPKKNETDLIKMPKNIKSSLKIIPVDSFDKVVEVAIDLEAENSGKD